jgi:hypothetical protein
MEFPQHLLCACPNSVDFDAAAFPDDVPYLSI